MSIIVAFPKPEIAKNIRNILIKSGYQVQGVAATGSQALQLLNELEYGIIVCGYRFRDMMCSEIAEYMPDGFEMLLVASRTAWQEKKQKNIVCLSMPFKVYELASTVEMMAYGIERRRRKRRSQPRQRSPEEQALIARAKAVLMERNHMDEEEAHRYLQKSSMDAGSSLTETAQIIVSMLDS